MKIIRGPGYLVIGFVVMVMVVVMTRRLMMQLVFRPRVPGYHRALMEIAGGRCRRWMMMVVMMMMIVSVGSLLDMVALMRIDGSVRAVRVLRLVRVRRRRRVVQVGVA